MKELVKEVNVSLPVHGEGDTEGEVGMLLASKKRIEANPSLASHNNDANEYLTNQPRPEAKKRRKNKNIFKRKQIKAERSLNLINAGLEGYIITN